MPTMIVRWACSFCGEEHDTQEEAAGCEALGFEPAWKVGDVVFARSGFGWYDGDQRWISNPNTVLDTEKHDGSDPRYPKQSNCFGKCCTYRFYYVVTAIDGDYNPGEGGAPFRKKRDAHRPRYHLTTGAMGPNGHHSGYTYDSGHCGVEAVDDPPDYVRVDSLRFIGEKADRLL